jgi:multiple sugar transport system ATP-binding protein
VTLGDRIAVMRAGRIQQVGTPADLYAHPVNLFVAGFIGSPAMNLIEVPIVDGGVRFGNALVNVERDAVQAAADKGDRTVTVGVRPEHFDIANGSAAGLSKDGPVGLAVTVNVVEELGADGYVYGTARVGDEDKDVVIRVGGREIPEKGSVLHVVPRPDETHVFATSSGERLSD